MSASLRRPLQVLIQSKNNIYANLATQEVLFTRTLHQPTLMLWRNQGTVVIGRHQNPFKECHLQNMKNDHILLSRRKSGGGAVFHTLDNLCFSFITPHDVGQPIVYKEANNKILLSALSQLGIEAESVGRNDLCYKGLKFSGSAFQLSNSTSVRRSLHHGTILMNVAKHSLNKYLNPNKLKLKSKGIQSVVSRVTNLKEHFPGLESEQVSKSIIKAFQKHYNRKAQIIMDLQDQSIKQKQLFYSSWDWLYGNCPDFQTVFQHKFDWGLVEVNLQVRQGIIQKCRIYSDCLILGLIDQLEQKLLSVRLSKEQILKVRSSVSESGYQSCFNETVKWLSSRSF